MRVTIDHRSPHYFPNAEFTAVFFNGSLARWVQEADDVEGWIRVLVEEPQTPFREGHVRYGEVRFVFHDRAGRERLRPAIYAP